MQGAKGLWNRFLGFWEGEIEEDWDSDDDVTSHHGHHHYNEKPELDLAGTTGYDRRERIKKSNNVVDFDVNRTSQDLITVMIVRPKEVQDATLVCDYLQNNKICVIDMQEAEHVTAQRIADYLGGVSYALGGHVERVDGYIFIMTPKGVKINSDLREELKSGGIFKSFR